MDSSLRGLSGTSCVQMERHSPCRVDESGHHHQTVVVFLSSGVYVYYSNRQVGRLIVQVDMD